jgi:16S rRNA processing protein RimM
VLAAPGDSAGVHGEASDPGGSDPVGAPPDWGEPGSVSVPVLVGEIARAHGIRGEVIVNMLSERSDRFAPGAEVWVGPSPEEARPARIARSRMHQGRIILLLEETLDRTMAEALRGALLFAPPAAPGEETDAPGTLEEDAYWEHDLVGLEVRDPSGARLGALTGVLSRPEQDLWEMEGPTGTVLIPATKAIVRSVDVAGGFVVVDPPPGLLG